MTRKQFDTDDIHKYGICVKTRTIYLHGHLDSEEDPGVDFRMSSAFIKNFQILESINHNPIFIHQHSIGGEWFCGISMYDVIKNSQCHVTYITHGEACSMGSIVPLAADLVLTMPNCIWTLHEGQTGINPAMTIKQSRSAFKMEEETTKVLYDIYAGKIHENTGVEHKKIIKKLKSIFNSKEDFILNASGLIDLGLVDGIIGSVKYPSLQSIMKNVY